MELTADFRDFSGGMLFSSRSAGLVMREFPEIDQPELWQEPETLYGVETAMQRSAEPKKLRPRKITLSFSFLSADPKTWYDNASYVRRQIHGKRVRMTLCERVGGGIEIPLYTNTHEEDGGPVEREMYYEGIASVGGVEAEGRAARLEIGLLADPWLYTQWRHETITVNETDVSSAVEWNKPTLMWCSQVRFYSAHSVGTRDESGAIPTSGIADQNRLRVRWTGGQRDWYPLFVTADGKLYDSEISQAAAWSFAVTGGDVDFDPAYCSFNVLPLDLAANSALAFTGRGTVTIEYREGLAI